MAVALMLFHQLLLLPTKARFLSISHACWFLPTGVFFYTLFILVLSHAFFTSQFSKLFEP